MAKVSVMGTLEAQLRELEDEKSGAQSVVDDLRTAMNESLQ